MAGGYRCHECGFDVWIPIWENDELALGLYDDGRFPGRAILAWRVHREHLEELGQEELSRLWGAATRAAYAIRRATGAPRVNYAVLGNVHAHVHIHLIPRFPDSESAPHRPPWEDPRPPSLLAEERAATLVSAIALAFTEPPGSEPAGTG